jgi:hypothetical protein
MIIPSIRFKQSNDPEKIFRTADADALLARTDTVIETREMDCMDCHNRPAHNYYPANQALDLKMMSGDIPRELPYIKRQALDLITRPYSSQQEAQTKIAAGLRSWYRENYPEIDVNNGMVSKAILGIQAAYRENVFPAMQVGWDSYIDHIGHGEDFDRGCFRCHDGKHFNSKGEPISDSCNNCHVILAEDDPDPKILKALEGR